MKLFSNNCWDKMSNDDESEGKWDTQNKRKTVQQNITDKPVQDKLVQSKCQQMKHPRVFLLFQLFLF